MFTLDIAAIGRTIVVGSLSYVSLIVLLRISGKRTLSKMNAFDFIVTVALGSSLATMLLSKNSFFEGLTAFTLLIALQFIITWLSVRSTKFRSFVKAEPRLLFFQGSYIERALTFERVTQDEVVAAIRSQGAAQLEDIEAVVLETDGSMSVLQRAQGGYSTALQGVVSPDTSTMSEQKMNG